MLIDRLDVYTAQAGFYLMMSVVPMLFLFFALLKYTPLTRGMMMEALATVLTPDAMDTVKIIVDNVYDGSITWASFATLSLLWVIGKGVQGLANGLNSIYHLREERSFVFLRIRSSLYTILLTASFILTLGLLVAGVRVQNALLKVFPIMRTFSAYYGIPLRAAGLIAMTLIFDALYVFLPNRKKKFFSQMPGAIFTTISWLVFSYFFRLYLSVADNMDVLYGGLLTVIIAMFWLYWLLYLFFFGAEINAWRENPDILPY